MPDWPMPAVPAPGTTSGSYRENKLAELRAWHRQADRERLHAVLAELKRAGVRVRFRRTAGTRWGGNGFGTTAAEYDLLVDGVKRGRYSAHERTFDGRLVTPALNLLGWELACCEKLAEALADASRVERTLP